MTVQYHFLAEHECDQRWSRNITERDRLAARALIDKIQGGQRAAGRKALASQTRRDWGTEDSRIKRGEPGRGQKRA